MRNFWKNATVKDTQDFIKSNNIHTIYKNLGLTTLTVVSKITQNPLVVRELIKAGADVNAKDDNDSTALINVAYYNKNPEVMKELINAGADLNAARKDKFTPLMAAATDSRKQ